ncbi:MAG: hypothetical protein IOC82_12460 [Aestuariivirga sp.]|uniref:head-tail joining protein n=1 Tax=Aestuariivirga sp. TaxID=2650926 RepID=UPI0025C19FA3|nr:hypothetical protein [Aestuariivirga sp.]MCA3561830.1 hypothetical protein [Aestuariivirga sp.]
MNVFAAATDVLFADPNLGETALWQADGVGPCVPVRVIRRRPDAVVEFGASRALMATVLLDLRRAEVSVIDEGDLFVIGAETFKIIGMPASDPMGLVLTCEAVKV